MIWTILHHLRKRRQLDQSDQLEHAAEHGHHSPWLRAGEDIRSSRRNPASFCTAFITHVFHTSLECVSQQINSSAVNTQHCDNWNSLADSIMLPHNAVWYTTVSETSIGKTAFTALQYHPFAIIFTANHKRYTAYRTAVSVHWTFKTSKGRSLRSVENHSPPTGKDFLPGSSCVKHRKQADWTETDRTNKKITYARVCVIGFQTLWMSSQPQTSTLDNTLRDRSRCSDARATPSGRKTSFLSDSAYRRTDSVHAECIFLHSVHFGTSDV